MMGGSARENAVVVPREALHLHERLTAAVRAAGEVGMLRAPAVKGRDRRLGGLRHHVDAAVAVVRHFLGMSEGPAGLGCSAGMPRVGGSRSVPLADGRSHCPEVHLSCESSVALATKPAVPAARRHPDFDLDSGVRAGRRQHGHSAERGQRLEERGIAEQPGREAGRRRELSGEHGLRRSDLRLRERELLEAGARLRRGRRGWPWDPRAAIITAVSTLPMPSPLRWPRACRPWGHPD